MKYILTFLLLLCSLIPKAQTDSILRSDKLGVLKNGSLSIDPVYSTITYTHKGVLPYHFKAVDIDNPDSAGISVNIDSLTSVKKYASEADTSENGIYFYYTALIENNKERIVFAIKYDFDRTINSFGLLRTDGSIIIFYLKRDQDPSL